MSHLRLITVDDLIHAVRAQTRALATPSSVAWSPPGDVSYDSLTLSVRGAHPGAGASTIAVALIDALAATTGEPPTLVDLAPDEHGAMQAIDARADLGLQGWAGGRRNGARIVQPEVSTHTSDVVGDVVIDVDRQWNLGLDILVCRPTIPSAHRAEAVLTGEDASAIAVVGAHRWPSPVRASLGPRLHAAWRAGRIVFFPRESDLEINGLSADPLPKSTLRAAAHLLDVLATDAVATTGAPA